ncbi:TrkA-C domain protein [Luminiphilus syltensis NOR5-1B]|uniref:TrkA-C domain protein n=1 Tax=Luminiphilus syltensis NOR5-1B TaxID=565045 RepID=B8KXK5_9GAMM|nr:SLC13 family permease [Luminiphilus syltensis]EED36061.1 TrkA-C domain protein [Luminiphilus syltensis NOR5-1B]
MPQLFMSMVVISLLLALIFTRFSAAWLFSIALLSAYFIGLVDTPTILAKAANEGLITLILLMLVSIGLERLPWLTTISSRLASRSLGASILRLSAVTALFSAFVNNTAVVATLAGSLRKNTWHSPSRLLLPLSYAAILGGTLTLIGTSTNLIVSSFLVDVRGEGLSFFALLPVALPAAILGIFVMVMTRRWLPDNGRDGVDLDSYLVEAEVMPESRLIGKSVQENGLRDLSDLFLVEIVRNDSLVSPVTPAEVIRSGDKLIFSGDVTRVGIIDRFHGLRLFAMEEGLLSSNMTEVVIMPGAAVEGQTIKQAEFRARFDAAVVGLRRDGARLSGKLGQIRLLAGDTLMLAVGPDFNQRTNLRKNFVVVDDTIDSSSLPFGTSMLASAALAAMVLLTATGLISLIQGVALVLVCLLALRVVRASDLRRRFPFEIWLIIASALALSQAMTDTGLVAALINVAEPVLANTPPMVAIATIYFLTLVMTELMTNNAAAALTFPLAYSLGMSGGGDPLPYVMAVAFGASASFITPFGYTTNLMVQNLGGYRRKDYARYGTPISLAYSATVLTLIPIMYPL